MVFAIHWHESAMDLHVFPIPIPPPTSLPIPSLWVFPVLQPWALVSCIQPGLVICFTLDSILVSMLFSQNIPPSPSPTESQSLFCTSVRFNSCLGREEENNAWKVSKVSMRKKEVEPTPTIWSSHSTPREMKVYIWIMIYIQMFITALLVIAEDWK